MAGLVGSMGAAGCFLSQEKTGASNDEVVAGEDVPAILKSTLILEGGCIATKVGPRHLLTAARCVAGKAAFEAGQTISFKVASSPNAISSQNVDAIVDAADASDANAANVAATDDAAGADDAASKGAAPRTDVGAKTPKEDSQVATIAEVDIHDSYLAKCKDGACPFGSLAASDAKDIAVILLDADLANVPTVPVDLDSVGQSDPVIVLGSGCDKLGEKPTKLKTVKTIAVPAKSVSHPGSPYVQRPELVTRLARGYVVTRGSGWLSTEARLCKNDIGAPLSRDGQAAVAGVTSGFTMFDKSKLVPVTVHHTRVDETSKVGVWLESLGVETTHSCSDSKDGCVARDYDGGSPTSTPSSAATRPSDAGGDATAPEKDGGEDESGDPEGTEQPSRGREEKLPPPAHEYSPPPNDGRGYDAGTNKKKKQESGGCSAAPGSAPSSELALGFGLALPAAVRRRRR